MKAIKLVWETCKVIKDKFILAFRQISDGKTYNIDIKKWPETAKQFAAAMDVSSTLE